MTMNQTGTRLLNLSKKFLSHRHLPVILAIGAIIVMLPALKIGLVADDLPQRVIALQPDQLPPQIQETGAPAKSGSLPTVLRDFFFNMDPPSLAAAKHYGMLPWWTPDDLKLGLWRPVTAFTHWLDYRLFPDWPAVMHAENIAWFAGVVFLLAMIYRKLIGAGWVAGLAALMFLLDGNTYFPVAFVANRGFIMALFFGLMCLYEHHQWRAAKSRSGLWLSVLFMALALFANEGGVSTFAFILAYALVLETGSLRSRGLTILPSVLVIVLWRIIYQLSGFGVFHIGAYIDPSAEPLQFAREIIPRALILLAGQLPFLSPEALGAVNPSLLPKVAAFYCLLTVALLLVFLPWVRRDKMAAFWFAVMLFAVIPAATVMPVSKNLGFVAVGAYGLIASFVAGVVTRRLPASLGYRLLAWATCILLLVMHLPGAIAGRALALNIAPRTFKALSILSDVGNPPGMENKNVIVVNVPCCLGMAYAPAYKVYHHQPLPKSIRTLVLGCTSFAVGRLDDQTLVIESKAPDIFSCDEVGASMSPTSSGRPIWPSANPNVKKAITTISAASRWMFCKWMPQSCRHGLRSGSTLRWTRPISSGSVGIGGCFPTSPSRCRPSDRASRCPVRLQLRAEEIISASTAETKFRHAISNSTGAWLARSSFKVSTLREALRISRLTSAPVSSKSARTPGRISSVSSIALLFRTISNVSVSLS
jgi:hypothetical protein